MVFSLVCAGKVMKFVEKPSADDLASLARDPTKQSAGGEFLANMGIYVFKREALFRWELRVLKSCSKSLDQS